MEKIKCAFIFEILGRPPEHIKESLEEFIDRIGKVKEISIVRKIIHEPKIIEREKDKEDKNSSNKEELYTSFADIELEADDINVIFRIVLNMLPSNVEIISPNEIVLKNFDASQLLTELTIKLHRFDEVAKVLHFDREKLIKRIKELESKIEELEKNNKNKDKRWYIIL